MMDMDFADSLFDREIAIEQVFDFTPKDFQLETFKPTWKSPCWLNAGILISPQSVAARDTFVTNMMMSHELDAFAKLSWEKQLWASFARLFSRTQGKRYDDWLHELLRCYDALKMRLQETDSLFPQPFRFAKRQEYRNADLPTILQQNPESVSVYIASEKGTYGDYLTLRIHSSPPILGSQPKLWFQKRMPGSLHLEDFLPWFYATIRRLPKKHQPPEIETWVKRLLHFEPKLTASETGVSQSWCDKSKVIIVFGAIGKVGYRGMFHFERRDIDCIVRQNEVVVLNGKTRHGFADGRTMEMDRTCYLLNFDEMVAERVERQIIEGKRIHFGLDAEILGMICRSGAFIHAINAPVETIHRLCVEPGFNLSLCSKPREKHRLYELVHAGSAQIAMTEENR